MGPLPGCKAAWRVMVGDYINPFGKVYRVVMNKTFNDGIGTSTHIIAKNSNGERIELITDVSFQIPIWRERDETDFL